MNKKFASGLLYGISMLTATTIMVNDASGEVPADPKDVKKAIQILKEKGDKIPDMNGIQHQMEYPEGYSGLSMVIFHETTKKDKSVLSVNVAEQEGEYIKIMSIMDYGKMSLDGMPDGKPDGKPDIYFAVKIKESDVLRMIASGDTNMERHLLDRGDATPEMERLYDSAIEYIVKTGK